MKGHLLEPISRLRDLRDDIPAELDDLYARLMEKDPARRLISAEETAMLLKTIAQSHTTNSSSGFSSKTIANSMPPAMPPTLAAGPGATIPGVSDPGAAATMSWSGKEGTEIVDAGDEVTVHDVGGEATRTQIQLPSPPQPPSPPEQKQQPQFQPRTKSTAPPSRRNPLTIIAAGGAGLCLVLLLGVIVIKIVNKDGSTTELRVPDGASVEVLKDGKLLGKVDIEKGVPTKTPPTPPSPSTTPTVDTSTLAIAPFDAATARAHQEAWAKRLGAPVEFTNSIGMKFRLIPPGEFSMGMTPQEAESVAAQGANDENIKNAAVISVPAHGVRMTQPYYLGTYEVTQQQYEKVVGANPAFFSEKGAGRDFVKVDDAPQLPIESVSFIDAAKFCIKLSEMERREPAYSAVDDMITIAKGNGYRLPTEAEWEWACRAGSTTAWSCGGQDASLAAVAWLTDNSDTRTHPAGRLKPNPFGLHDMHGNVWEHCQDWYDAQAY
ncbi:MAG TPA: SUMF1/EgtB/PvdO family nonheme iron enzyme, partial [Pirellulaceae bacterium]|nr:SUMF1/EgtB/PvdO family nonheme iron enzyme [Pirellulaceae bacterium]